jgi:curved DNA-binding protein CbpA
MSTPDPLEQLDYYSLLQVEPQASADQVRRAFHRFAAKYHPDRFTGAGADAAKVERAAQIYRRGAEAYKVLMDSPRRKLYDAGLAKGRLRLDPAAEAAPEPAVLGQWPIKVKNPMARPFAIKAEQLYKAGDFGNAKTNLKLALQKDKGNMQIELLLADVEQKLTGGAAKR